ncbi:MULTISPECIES: mandelate racemase/muconate lactonizing enzyme family protein [Methylobacterium]|jgi:L-alanine-DL-glutamate epimerase-like enolase superfamily enzyme|uniref:mandelate racemase/muconate lactonizing enzyme family protein n=1 Tax=Methylobacterium TaxID=407 RepID=UPI0008EF1C4C|nr:MULTISPECIES: mandelate racemase/muconate lactonizing enzyme family protein [Methylobacterium]MBZ6413803.1 mandelate racemase/muconate lactonizing enzyme family protein [Methylobacterium sp.]MBK3395951.1 mandelate racemase/muconate lactonizing enzyme family protein [Methylobacterium ajmalii]MBK3412130.1 mandelate racemase/muconate lactonizing enzyme family protein [Methylobacterium ajmalii]MBK3425504.1 mandelate racemase/muconate lactonizing enzyme family protein [Methylobacterium ajmalii]S
MRITAIRDIVAPIKSDIANAWIDFSTMTASVVAVVTDAVVDGRPVVGFGFNSNGRYAPQGLLRERFIPRLLAAAPEELQDEDGVLDPHRAWAAMMKNEKPGGHGERSVAVGVLDMALWDALAKAKGVPLWRLLADRYRGGEADPTAWVYAAGGYYYPGKGLDALQDEMRSYLDRGYSTVKMKVGLVPLAEDVARIEAVLAVLGGDGSRLCVDVNGRFTLEEAIRFGRAVAPYGLRWYEEPVDPLDYLAHAALATTYDGPLATGENLFSHQDARNLIRHGGLRPDRDILQFDPALSYGLVEYLRTLDVLRAHGWSPRRCVPHGGHQFALNIAVGLGLGGNESYPDVFAPFGGFADAVPVEDSRVAMPDVPGIGFEAKNALYAVMRPLERA